MKAIRMHEFGEPDVLRYEEVPVPEPAEGEVLVKVYAAGVNPADWKSRQTGGLYNRNGASLPIIPGWDMSGVIEQVGPGVVNFSAGQEVYGMVRFPKPGSTYAEYLTTPVSDIALKPEFIDHILAAGVPLVALTAWQGLFEFALLTPGQRIMVNGAAGGVGHFIVEFARWKGAHVIGTASARNADFLHSRGVDEVIDYNTVQFEDVVHDVDVYFEAVSAANATRGLQVIRRGGVLVSCAGLPSPEAAAERDVKLHGFLVRPEGSQLTEIATLIDDVAITPYVDAVFPLAEAGKAHALGEEGHTRGKIVLRVRE